MNLGNRMLTEMLGEGPGAARIIPVADVAGLAVLVPPIPPHVEQALTTDKAVRTSTQMNLHAGKEGIAIEIAVKLHITPEEVDIVVVSDPANDSQLLALLSTQESLPVQFYSLDNPTRPILETAVPWLPALQSKTAEVLTQAKADLAHRSPPLSFRLVRDAILHRSVRQLPQQVVTQAFRSSAALVPSDVAWGRDGAVMAAAQAQQGFSWGSTDKAHIGVAVLPGSTWGLSPQEIVYAEWICCSAAALEDLPGGGRSWKGIAALIPPGKIIRYAWPAKENPIAGLREIVEDEQVHGEAIMPWPIVGSFYAAIRCLIANLRPSAWKAVIDPFVSPTISFPESRDPAMSKKEMERAVSGWKATLEGIPGNPYDRARFIWHLGRLGWGGPPQVPWVLMTASSAAAYKACSAWPWRAELQGGGYLQAAEPTASGSIALWHLWAAFQLHGRSVSAEAVDFLLPGRTPQPAGDALIEEGLLVSLGVVQIPRPADPGYLRGTVRELIREARDNQAYAPQGAFRVSVPPGTVLEAWGLKEARLWVERDGMWASLVADADRVTNVVWWEPKEGYLSDFPLTPQWSRSALEAFLAALWRDLLVAGPPAFPVEKPKRQPASSQPVSPRRRQSRPSADRPYALPRRRSRPSQGVATWPMGKHRHEWGDQHDRKAAAQSRRITPHRRVILYAAEQGAAVLLAVAANAPIAQWESRKEQSVERFQWFGLPRDKDESIWWETVLEAARRAGEHTGEGERVATVRTVLERARADCPERPGRQEDLHLWLGRGLRALEEAEEMGVSDALEPLLAQIDAVRAAARDRAEDAGLPPPPAGYTVVVPADANRRRLSERSRVIHSRGLAALYEALRTDESN